MNHSFCVGRERRNPDGGQVAIPERSEVPVFFLLAASFLCSTPGFSSRLSVDNRSDPLYI